MNANGQAGWRILVPLDDSEQARRALAYATELARASNGTVRLIRVTDPAADTGSNSLAAIAERLRQAGVSVEWNIVDSRDVASAVVVTARGWPADLVVMATSKRTGLDRWLNDSVTDAVIRSAHEPVLVVPPDWQRPMQPDKPLRVLVPLDGSSLSELVLPVLLPLANARPMQVVLVRAVSDSDSAAPGADAYLRQVGSRIEDVLGHGHVVTRVQEGGPTSVILDVAHESDVDAIAMCTHGRSGLKRAMLGSTATSTLEQSSVPLLLLGPGALLAPTTAQIHLRAPVRTSDGQVVGEVHRVVVDLDQHAVSSVVVLGRGLLGRDVLVPADFIARVNDDGLELNLTGDELDRLPDFSWNDYFTPPPTWTDYVPRMDAAPLVPVSERKRVGRGEQDITPGTRVSCSDGDIGTVQRVEIDRFGRLEAFWVRADGVLGPDLRIPVEWLQGGEHNGHLRVAAKREDVESYLGFDSRARLHPR